MADPAIGFDRGVDPAAYSPYIGGDRFAPDRGQGAPRSGEVEDAQRQDLTSLIKLGVARLEAGADAEATDCFRKALDIGDRTLGPDNPDLVLLLNDLTRLYLKQSLYADAEPLLLRLLDIKRAKGEEHPEVATVLASLATVQQALGRHESAEQLWRRVLDIRERTLAPNHFAIATALEHLGDACAARGNITEALPAFQRALTIRERTLGSGHPSLRVSRERIGDLQLQSAEETIDPSAASGIPAAPKKHRLITNDYPRLSPPPTATREVVAAREAIALPAISRALVTTPRLAPESGALEVPPVRDQAAIDSASRLPAELASYRDVLESMREELEAEQQSTPLAARIGAVLESLAPFVGKRQVVAGSIVLVVSLLFVAVAKDRASGGLGQERAASTVAANATLKDPQPATLAALSIPVRLPSSVVATPSAQPKSAASKPRVEERTPPKRAEEAKSESKRLSLPTVPKSLISNLDAVASKAAIATPGPDPLSEQPAPIKPGTSARTTFETADQSSGPVRARLIGELPTPKVPPQVADVEGDVRVRFNVDAAGEPVMSTFAVVTSPNPLLTAAVRRVIPSLRFEPARTGGPDSKAIADVVETGFRFARLSR